LIQKLTIQNYAIIDELTVHFTGRLNVITGETGAGKSIIVGALGLILGERADTSILVNKEKKCVVEGWFTGENTTNIRHFLLNNDLDGGDDLVIRREINTSGKSRAFINDTPVTLTQLNELSKLLVDLHQQFDNLEIGQSEFQRQVLDAMADHAKLYDRYQALFNDWQSVKKSREELKDKKAQFDKEADYNRFQFTELDEAGFHNNEIEEAEATLKTLNHAEEIKGVLNKAFFGLCESEEPLVQQVKTIQNLLQPYHFSHPDLPGLLQRLLSAQIELQDVGEELGKISEKINYDAEHTEQLNERLSLGYRLQKKHGVHSTRELLEIKNQLEKKLQAVLDIEEQMLEREKEFHKLFEEATLLAEKISTGRKKQVKLLEEKVNRLLARVGMPNAKLKVEIKKGELGYSGIDVIDFLFNANIAPGDKKEESQFKPVQKVASGGELSRLMLCIKSLVAQSIDLPTLIFDEIDTGISGEAARQVGIIMKELANSRQVICITHQPQIAGKADTHFLVFKEIAGELIKTNIRQLTTEERITTIAKMLSGEKPTAAAIENAREIMMN